MTSLTIDRLAGLSSAAGIKGPCAVATTTNITLAGEQTIDGVLTSSSRVLVKNQTDQTQNGIWYSSSTDWTRSPDFSRTDDVVTGTQVRVVSGSGAGIYVLTTAGTISFDTSNIVFTKDTALTAGLWDAIAAKGNDIATATSINLSSPSGPIVSLTGTNTVTSVALAEGALRFCRSTSAFLLTASASLIVNGSSSVNYTTAPGDLLIFIGYSAGVVSVWSLPSSDSSDSAGTAIASAATITLPTADNYFHVTGTSTITDIDFTPGKDGAAAVLVFDGVLTLTHNATSLILPGGTNIATAAGDTCMVVQDSGDNVRVVWYQRAGAVPAGAVLASQIGYPTNLSLAATVAANALTISLKGADGNDPSPSNPVYVPFRNVALGTGTPTVLTITSAMSLLISSGSTLGFTSAIASRFWLVMFNDAGTPRIGVVNCLNGTDILRLEPGTASATAEGGAGAADSAQVFYAGAAVTSKAYTVIGRMEWSTGLTTAGTWDALPSQIVLFREGIRLPGNPVTLRRIVSTSDVTGTTVLPDDDTIPQNTEGVQMLTKSITPNACNLLRIRHLGQYASTAADNYVTAALFQDSGANAIAAAWGGRASAGRAQVHLEHVMLANIGSSTTFTIRAGSASAGTIEMNGKASGRLFGGVATSFLEIEEIVA